MIVLAPGAVVVDGAAPPTDEISAVYRGQVQLWAVGDDPAGEPLETVNPGEIFGFRSLLTGESAQFTARMQGSGSLVRLPGQSARPVFSRPAGLSYLAGQVSTGVGQPPVPFDAVLGRRPVGALLHADPVLVPGETSVRDAVRQMTEMRSSYVLIPLDNGEFGIFTDRDLRTRVVAVDRSVSEPVRSVVSAPARVVSEDRLVSTVLIEMIEHGMRHMPVVNGRGQVLGVLEDSDLLAASTRRGFVLRRSIALSATADDLVQGLDRHHRSRRRPRARGYRCHRHQRDPLGDDRQRGPTSARAEPRRGRRPATGEIRLDHAGERRASGGHALVRPRHRDVLAGRRRARRRTLSGHRPPGARDPRCLRCSRMATEPWPAPPFCPVELSDWLRATQQWMAAPLEDHGLVMSSLLVDGRVVGGLCSAHRPGGLPTG